MQINIVESGLQTLFFTLLLVVIVVATIKRDSSSHHYLNISHTNELKGIAILMVIFSHIGYFLDSKDQFLYPLSVAGGVGVNIFLFLSGFGLTTSALKNYLSPLSFYKKRLLRIFTPMWLILGVVLIADFFVLNLSYPLETIIYSILGFFPDADIYTSINSPLWYFSLILFYYLVFPFLFWKKHPILSGGLIILLSVIVLNLKLPVNEDVLKLYKLHFLAFPIGICFAVFLEHYPKLDTIKDFLKVLSSLPRIKHLVRFLIIAILFYLVGFTAIHSGVGEGIKIEHEISLVTMMGIILIVMLKKYQSRFLILLGMYSYEIYLIQWPLLYRYDFLYKYLPASLATFLYLIIFIMIGILINKLTNIFSTRKS